MILRLILVKDSENFGRDVSTLQRMDSALKQLRAQFLQLCSRCVDKKLLVSTSNVLGKLFCITGYALTDISKSLLLANIEGDLSLFPKPSLCGIDGIK